MNTVKKIKFNVDTKCNNQIIEKVIEILNQIVNMNVNSLYSLNSPYVCYPPPEISVRKYIERLKSYTHMEKSTLILALIYIDRLCNINKLILTPYNIHKILVGTILVAIKYNEDRIFKNSYYSKAAGLTLNEINSIEVYTLSLLEFNLYVDLDTFGLYSNFLISNESTFLYNYKQ